MIAVVPTRDEAETIGQTVTDLRLLGCIPIVVDSSENDATMATALAMGASVVDCREDGLGPAYLAGWKESVRFQLTRAGFLSDPPPERILHADAGGSHPYTSLHAVVHEITDADVVIGSRFCEGALYVGNPRRRRMSRLAADMCNLASWYDFTDWTSGLRVYSPRAIEILRAHEFQTKGHAWQIEALDVCARAGLTIKEVPITYVAGRSHLSWARIREAARYWWSMLCR